MNDEYAEFKENPGDNILAQISATALQQKRLEAELARMEEDVQKKKDELRNISERVLPELMDAAGQTEVTTKDGIKVKVEDRFQASIPVARAHEAFAWLKEHGHDSLIKNEFKVEFGRDQDKLSEEFKQYLEGEWEEVDFKNKKSVHASTLKAFVKEQVEEGVNIPFDLFGVLRQRFTKLK